MDASKIEKVMQEAAAAQLSREDVQAILDGLAAHLGIDHLKLDDDGSTTFLVDDELPVTLVHVPSFPGVVVSAPVADGMGPRGTLLTNLLQANMSWALTRGGAFGMLPEDGEIQLSRHILLADRDVERIDHELSAFVEDVTSWTQQIDLYLDTLGDPETQDAPDAGPRPGSFA